MSGQYTISTRGVYDQELKAIWSEIQIMNYETALVSLQKYVYENPENADGWNATCAESTDCSGETDFCAKQPGAAEGYCSIPCTTTADCPYGEWSCNVIGPCESPAATWCGPREEVETFAGIITACDPEVSP